MLILTKMAQIIRCEGNVGVETLKKLEVRHKTTNLPVCFQWPIAPNLDLVEIRASQKALQRFTWSSLMRLTRAA